MTFFNIPQSEFRSCTACGDSFIDYPGCVLVTEKHVHVLCELPLRLHAESPDAFYKLLALNHSRGLPLLFLELVL